MKSIRRPLMALLVLASLLFTQLAVAAYACPGMANEDAAAEAAGAAPQGPDCDRMSRSQRDALCAAHCQQGDQSRDTPSVSLPAAPAGGTAALVVVAQDEPGPRARLQGFALERRIEPPATLRHCRLHI